MKTFALILCKTQNKGLSGITRTDLQEMDNGIDCWIL